jgi:hypothetical protein
LLMIFYLILVSAWSVFHHQEINNVMVLRYSKSTDHDWCTTSVLAVGAMAFMVPWQFVTNPSSRRESGDFTVPLKTIVVGMNTIYLIHMVYFSYLSIRSLRRFFECMSPVEKMVLVPHVFEKAEQPGVLLYKHDMEANLTHDLAMLSEYMDILIYVRVYFELTYLVLLMGFIFCGIYVAVLFFEFGKIGVLETNYITTLMLQYLIKAYQIAVWNTSVVNLEERTGLDIGLRVKFLSYELSEHLYVEVLYMLATYTMSLIIQDNGSNGN